MVSGVVQGEVTKILSAKKFNGETLIINWIFVVTPAVTTVWPAFQLNTNIHPIRNVSRIISARVISNYTLDYLPGKHIFDETAFAAYCNDHCEFSVLKLLLELWRPLRPHRPT